MLRFRHRPGSLPLLLLVLLCAGRTGAPAHAGAAPPGIPRPAYRALGAAAGIPQIVALTYEHQLGDRLVLGLPAGSIVLVSSLGARLQYGSVAPGLHPYLFAGGVAIFVYALDSVADGGQGYFWSGAGLNWTFRSWGLFGEGGLLLGGRDERGFDDDTMVFPVDPVVAAGIKIRLGG